MKNIKEVISNPLVSPYRGSEKTYEHVREQLRERYDDTCANEFDPRTDAMPLTSWASYGYRVRKGEKALKSITYMEVKNDKDEVEKKIRRVVNLFHKRQVEKVV